MRKKLFGEIPASEIFKELVDCFKTQVTINEWLQPHTFRFLQKTRDVVRQKEYEREWVINEVISVRKNASSPKIEIFCEADLDKLI